MSGLVLLWCIILLGSLPAVVFFFMPPMPAWVEELEHPQAVVVLGPNRLRKHRDYQLSSAGWRRAGVGIAQAKKHQLPILFAGGKIEGKLSEARLMAQAVEAYWPTARVWLEEESLNTWQKAACCAALLQEQGVRRILLVSDRTHLPRAMYAFRAHGVFALPYSSSVLPRPGWMPSAGALSMLLEAYYEWVALGWYWLRYR